MDSSHLDSASKPLRRGRLEEGRPAVQWQSDAVAVEEPLEIRIRGQAYAVLMRTPGRERDLIAGFLASEGILHGHPDLAAIEACRNPEDGKPEAHVWNVALAEGLSFTPRGGSGMVSSSCGLCGTQSLAELQKQVPERTALVDTRLSLRALVAGFEAMRARQELYAATAGCHGVGLWDPESGRLQDVAEDVGRHNAVDKLLGARLLADDYPLERPQVLLVSGRISFELVQKAALAGLSALAGVGMPTSLAVQAAEELGLGLLGWVRGAGAHLYTGAVDLEP